MTSTTSAASAATYRLNPDGSIDLYADGAIFLRVGEIVSIPRLPAKRLQYAVMAELGDAMRRGAAHGECDRMREIANALNGEVTPGCVQYDEKYTGENPGVRGLFRYLDGAETRVLADLTIRPAYLMGFIVNELERAFRVGGRFGAGGAPVVHLTRVVCGSDQVTGGFKHHHPAGGLVAQYGWFASAFCTCGKRLHTGTDREAARRAAASHRAEMERAGHLVGIDR